MSKNPYKQSLVRDGGGRRAVWLALGGDPPGRSHRAVASVVAQISSRISDGGARSYAVLLWDG